MYSQLELYLMLLTSKMFIPFNAVKKHRTPSHAYFHQGERCSARLQFCSGKGLCSPTPKRGTFVTHVLYYTVTVVVNSVIFHFCPKKRTLGDQIKEPLRAICECQKKVPDKNAKKAANKKFQIQNNLAPVFCN